MTRICSDEITIHRGTLNCWSYGFKTAPADYMASECKCLWCDTRLDGRYSDIIFTLIDAELLPQNYEMLCCNCYLISQYSKEAGSRCGCGEHLTAELIEGEVCIYCSGNCGYEETFMLNNDDEKYLEEFKQSIQENIDYINEEIAEAGGLLSETDKAFLGWLIGLKQ